MAWGGPVAQIALIKRELVEEEQWVSHTQFNRALAVFQALPGPEAHELCVYMGAVVGGFWGGFVAGLGFMLPGLILMLGAISLYVQFGLNSNFVLVFTAVQAAVIALISMAVYKIGKHALINRQLLFLAFLSMVLTFFDINIYLNLLAIGLLYTVQQTGKPIHVVCIVFALSSLVALKLWPDRQISKQNTPFATPKKLEYISDSIAPQKPIQNPNNQQLATIFLTGLKGGLLTFGGAYTAIPFIKNDAVNTRQWLSEQQFLDGVAIANILPAPLVIFATFIGYFGGAWWGALIITLGMFLPSFAFTLLGFNAIERLIQYKPLHTFLDGVTAAVVGIIALTTLQLAYTTLANPWQIMLCMAAIFALYYIKSKFTPLGIVVFAALFGYCRLVWEM